MVRVKRANGTWEELDAAKRLAEPFQRTNGSRMTQDEIAAVGKVVPIAEQSAASFRVAQPAEPVKRAARPRISDELVDAAWHTWLTCTSWTTGAAALGVGVKLFEGRVRAYMSRHGLTGTPSEHRDVNTRKGPSPIPVIAPRPNGLTANDRERIALHNAAGQAARAAGLFDKRPTIADDDSDAPIIEESSPSTRKSFAPPTIVDPAVIHRDRVAPESLDHAIERVTETAGRLEAIHDDLLDGWAQELSEPQALLVLTAGMNQHRYKPVELVGYLRRHGFELVIRLAEAPL